MSMTRNQLTPGTIVRGCGDKAEQCFDRRIERWSGNQCFYRVRTMHDFLSQERRCNVSTICEWADRVVKDYP